MPVQTALWAVGDRPQQLTVGKLPTEKLLEEMIVADPRLLSDDWLLIGRQEDTGHGGRIDLLAVAPDGSPVLVELKRDQTPREVVAQALDYAAWVETLRPEDIHAIYARFRKGGDLAADFAKRFGQPPDEEALNTGHQIVIVAGSLDPRTERVVGYLSQRDITINVLCFQVFEHAGGQLLCRSWLLDPAVTQAAVAATAGGSAGSWNNEFYCNFGDGPNRSWGDALQFGFVSAGGGAFYTGTLRQLAAGDRVWVKAPGRGFVGVGRVVGPAQPAAEFQVRTPDGVERPVLEVAKGGKYHQDQTDPDRYEWFVPVRWLDTVPLDQAVKGGGLFGNTNTVCKPKAPAWNRTVERLKQAFPRWDAA